jgi:hypothetical protein
MEGIAEALGDRAGVDIAIVDQPAFLADFQKATAAELGHALLKRGPKGESNRPIGLRALQSYYRSRVFKSPLSFAQVQRRPNCAGSEWLVTGKGRKTQAEPA